MVFRPGFTLRHLAPAVMAVVTAASLVAAPTAGASANPADCRDGGGATLCQKRGHSALRAEPGIRQPVGGLWHPAWLPGYGRGQLPPFLAFD